MRDFDEFLEYARGNDEFGKKIIDIAKDVPDLKSEDMSSGEKVAKFIMAMHQHSLDMSKELLRVYHEWLSSQLDEPSNHR